MNNRFNWQSFISIGLLFSFIVMFVSGIILYIAPEGSLSRWIAWDILGLTKSQWEHQHTVFSYVFILFSIFHIFKINWGLILSYFFIEKINFSNMKEITIAVFITAFVFWGTLYNLSPFSSVINLGKGISDNHSEGVVFTNIPDAEKLSLNEFSQKVFNISYSDLIISLEKSDLQHINENITVNDFCNLNNITPEDFFILLKGKLLLSKDNNTKSPMLGTPSSYSGNKKAIP